MNRVGVENQSGAHPTPEPYMSERQQVLSTAGEGGAPSMPHYGNHVSNV